MQIVPNDVPDDPIDRVSDLLAQVLEAPLADQPDVLAALCAQHHECADALRKGYGSLQQLDLVQVAQHLPGGVASTSEAPGLPRTLGPFRLLELLGAGGMGAVYRAEDSELKRPVALKLIRSELLASARTRERFARESAALARLEHPGLCTAYRAGTTDGQPWIAMRLVRGTTLAQQIEARRREVSSQHDATAGRRSSSQARREVQHLVRVFEKVARALATAHAVGVVHRDIKPGNLVLTGDDEPVVIDFGLVHLDDSDSHLTVSGDHIGTPAYMAPEQVEATGREVAPTTDIFALGVTMFEALTLQSPYQAKNRDDLFACIVRGKRRRLRQVEKTLPTDLELVLEKALELEPARRYASMVEFADDLRRYLAHEPLVAAPPSTWYRLRKLVRRYPGPVAAGSAVFATAVVGAVVALQFAWREQAKLREFDLLSGVVLYDRALAGEKELHPPWPHKLAAMEKWLRDDVGRLRAIAPDVDQALRRLRQQALPWTTAERDADRRSHPEASTLERATHRVATLLRAQAIRDGTQRLVEPELPAGLAGRDAADLNLLAWERVILHGEGWKWEGMLVPGEEDLGLSLARAAAAKARGTATEFERLDTLAWALFANGQDEAAMARSAEATAAAPESEKAFYRGRQDKLAEQVVQSASILARAKERQATLARRVDERRTFRCESPADQFLHDALSRLTLRIEALLEKQKADVEKRLGWAKQIEALSLAHPNARTSWATARAAIAAADGVVANTLYAGKAIELRDQDILGLVPIGMNPVTKLWEFYDLRSAWDGTSDPRQIAIPVQADDGRIAVGDDTGIVLVLLPGGTFTMGAQSIDANGPNYDEQITPGEQTVVATLDPFFLARHELTQGQWARLCEGEPEQRRPSRFKAGKSLNGELFTWANPVEQVSWTDCTTLLAQHGLVLPTEAQWEYGCRAGTTTTWCCPHAELQRFANLADATAHRMEPSLVCEPWTDGRGTHAAVGTYAANAFGLHDVHGNVFEWCRDEYADPDVPTRPGDGLRLIDTGSTNRVIRGGCYSFPKLLARSAYRTGTDSAAPQGHLGMRCARLLRPLGSR